MLGEDATGLEPQPGCFYAFSSGSTGTRKALRFGIERARHNAAAHARSLVIERHHRIPQTLPLTHSFGIIAFLLVPLVTGARVRLGVFFDSLLRQQGEGERDVVHLTPYHLELFRRRRLAGPTKFAKLSLGAGPLQRELALHAGKLAGEVYATYGLSEAGPRVTTGRVDPHTFEDGWVGWCLEGVDHKLDEDGQLWLKSPYALHQDWFPTGDRFLARPDRSLVFQNRVHDVLRIRGQTVPRALYSARLAAAIGHPCEVAQRASNDELVVFVEATQPRPELEKEICRLFPELREASVVWKPRFERSVLGKVDTRKML